MNMTNTLAKSNISTSESGNAFRIRICQTVESILLILACASTAYLALTSIFTTGKFRTLDDKTHLLTTTEDMILYTGVPSILFIVGVIVLSIFFYGVAYLWSTHTRIGSLGLFLAAYTLFTSLLWLLSLNPTGNQYAYSDSNSLINAANVIVSGQKEMFFVSASGMPSSYDYFSWYPFQTGALLWFVIIFKLFGAGNIIAVQIINSFLLAGVVWILQTISSQLGLSNHGQRITALLIMISVPIIMSAAFVYTNLPGLFFILLAMLAATHSCRQTTYPRMVLWTSIAFLIGAMAVMIKGTVMIFLIAFTLMLIINAIRRKLFWTIPFILIALYIAKWLSGLSVPLVEHMVGQRFGSGLPQLSWIAIGLTQASVETSMPGWWNASAIQTYQTTLGDPQLQTEAAKNTILAALMSFAHDPVAAFQFFGTKLASEWSEPTYGTLYYSALMERRNNSLIAAHAFFGTSNALLISMENVYQSIVYMFSAVGLGWLFYNHRLGSRGEETNIMAPFLALIFLGGFGCFLLWEAKSIYVFPFAIMLIPVAAYGLEKTGNALKNKILRNRNAD